MEWQKNKLLLSPYLMFFPVLLTTVGASAIAAGICLALLFPKENVRIVTAQLTAISSRPCLVLTFQQHHPKKKLQTIHKSLSKKWHQVNIQLTQAMTQSYWHLLRDYGKTRYNTGNTVGKHQLANVQSPKKCEG